MKRANFWTSFKKVKASYALQSTWNSLCLKWIVIRSGLKFHIKFMEFYFKSIWVKELMSLITSPPHPTNFSLSLPLPSSQCPLYSHSASSSSCTSHCAWHIEQTAAYNFNGPPLQYHPINIYQQVPGPSQSVLFLALRMHHWTRGYHPLPPQKRLTKSLHNTLNIGKRIFLRKVSIELRNNILWKWRVS